METLKFWVSVAQVVIGVVLTLVVTFQTSKDSGLSGAIAGGTETFFGKQKGHSKEARLARATVWLAIVLAITTVALVVL